MTQAMRRHTHVDSNIPGFIREAQQRVYEHGIPAVYARCRSRKLRFERDEACRAVLCAALEFIDLQTLKLGMPSSAGWRPWSWSLVRERITWLTDFRFFEALRDLKIAQYIESDQRILVASKKTKSASNKSGWHVSDKSISERFFSDYGLIARLRHERTAKLNRVKKAAAAAGKTVSDFYQTHSTKLRTKFAATIADLTALAKKQSRKKNDNTHHLDIENQKLDVATDAEMTPRMLEMIVVGKLRCAKIQGNIDSIARELIKRYGQRAAHDPVMLI